MKSITEKDIEAGKSPRGGWTKETLARWGIPWPPPKGWRKRLTGGITIAVTTPKKATKKEIRTAMDKRFDERDVAVRQMDIQQEVERLDMKRLYQQKSGDYSY